MKIFLIGFMGSGKTTLGKLLADELKTSFIDLDERIEQDQGMSVSRIFGEKGEDFFRELEASVLRKIVSEENDFVLAMTGYLPDFTLLTSMGVAIGEDLMKTPVHDSATMQSNIPGIYLAGVICGGLKTNKWFIENSRHHADLIVHHFLENRA